MEMKNAELIANQLRKFNLFDNPVLKIQEEVEI